MHRSRTRRARRADGGSRGPSSWRGSSLWTSSSVPGAPRACRRSSGARTRAHQGCARGDRAHARRRAAPNSMTAGPALRPGRPRCAETTKKHRGPVPVRAALRRVEGARCCEPSARKGRRHEQPPIPAASGGSIFPRSHPVAQPDGSKVPIYVAVRAHLGELDAAHFWPLIRNRLD